MGGFRELRVLLSGSGRGVREKKNKFERNSGLIHMQDERRCL